ncbi:MAG TPA: c-type cytochrome, partial [Polyangiales bacterium]|nr:c-type cytochrome [Polyangiales bacterium]
PGSLELLGTVILPGLAGAFLFVLPLLDKGESRRARDRIKYLAPVLAGGLAIVLLTNLSLQADKHDAQYQRSLAVSKVRAERAIALAHRGIPPGGPLDMLKQDPLTRGPDLYAQHCNKCHVLDAVGEQDAPVHTGFGSRDWILGMIVDPQADHYFGKTDIDEMKPMAKKLGRAKALAVAEFLFAQGREPQDPPIDAALVKQGEQVFRDTCMDCHLYEGDGADVFEGPDMTGYASRNWILGQIRDPDALSQYGELNDMPSFAEDLDAQDQRMLAAFLRQQRFAKPAHPVGDIPAQPAPPAAKGDGHDSDDE